MATSTSCYPWFHSVFAPLAEGPQYTVSSGCRIGADGNIPCDPDAMRADAERQLFEAGMNSAVSLEAYTLARYMQGEVGGGTIEERVAVGEAAVNRAKLEGKNVLDILLYRQPVGHPNRGYYGPIHGVGTGVSTAPYGRWASTSADPTILTLLLAQLVASGQSGDFANGADDQDGPEYWIRQGQTALENYARGLAAHGKYWVGPLPGVDHWRTFLQITPGVPVNTDMGQALLQRGIDALSSPRPTWGDLPVCSRPMSKGTKFFLGLLGLGLGALAGRSVYKRWAQTKSL